MAPISKKGFRVEKAVILGEFWTALRNFVELLDPELIILGYEPHLIKIPTAEKILERLEISFLVVKENPLKKLNKILCPFDFSEKALSALKKALYYAEKTQAELIFLYVINPLESPDKTCNLQYVTEREKEIKENWKNLLNVIKPPEINFRFEAVCGNRLDEIMQKAEQESIDLIIAGRRGKILQTGIGSVSKALIKTSKIPVLLVN